MYLLFYSKRCKYSIKLIELLQEIREDKFFKMIEVAKVNGDYPNLVKKYKIKEVPTAIIDNRVYIGQQAFKWLEKKIKNINHKISSQDTRVNKTPILSGYSPDISSASLGQNDIFSGNSLFSPLGSCQVINTPDADKEYEKTSFILPNDNITNGNTANDDRPDRVSKIDQDLEKLLAERDIDNSRASKQRRY